MIFFQICILRVVLLDEAGSNYFYISSISVGPKKTQKYQNLENCCQEWKNPDITINRPGEYVYRVKVTYTGQLRYNAHVRVHKSRPRYRRVA